MSMASWARLPIPVLPHSKSFSARIRGVLFAPRSTFHAVSRAPHWLGVLTCTFLLSAGASALVLETEVGHFALLDRWERTAVAFGQHIDDSRYAAMGAAAEHGSLYAVASAFLSGPLLAAALSGLLVVTLRTPAPTATYTQVLAVVAHAGVVLALRQVVAAPIAYARETLVSPLTLRLLFSGLEDASLPARVSGAVDLFIVWWIVVLAIGMSVLYRRPARRLAVVFLVTYAAIALVLAVAMALTGGTS